MLGHSRHHKWNCDHMLYSTKRLSVGEKREPQRNNPITCIQRQTHVSKCRESYYQCLSGRSSAHSVSRPSCQAMVKRHGWRERWQRVGLTPSHAALAAQAEQQRVSRRPQLVGQPFTTSNPPNRTPASTLTVLSCAGGDVFFFFTLSFFLQPLSTVPVSMGFTGNLFINTHPPSPPKPLKGNIILKEATFGRNTERRIPSSRDGYNEYNKAQT